MDDLRYTLAELGCLGDAAYDREVAPHVTTEDLGRFVAIDVETGAYEIDADQMAATDRLLRRKPGAQCWLRRVGSRYAGTFGPRIPFDVGALDDQRRGAAA